MSTRVLLIAAAPTPWDLENRLGGAASLPLTAEGIDAIGHLLDPIAEPFDAVYRPGGSQACVEAAQIIAKKFDLRPRDNANLNEVALGLWQGLLPDDLRKRFPTVFSKWEEEPLTVTPPDGEPLESAIQRISAAVDKIIRRNRGAKVALALRPMAMQIASGHLKRQSPQEIAFHLHHRSSAETIEVAD